MTHPVNRAHKINLQSVVIAAQPQQSGSRVVGLEDHCAQRFRDIPQFRQVPRCPSEHEVEIQRSDRRTVQRCRSVSDQHRFQIVFPQSACDTDQNRRGIHTDNFTSLFRLVLRLLFSVALQPGSIGKLEIMRCLFLLFVAASLAPAQTYSGDIRSILSDHCVSCHSKGEVAPMAFTDHNQIRPWAAAIREAVSNGSMPPWHAAPGTAHAFRNDRSLTVGERRLIRAWVDHGAPEGEPSHSLASPAAASAWKLGTPNLVVKVPGFHVPKEGPLPYSFLIVPLHLDHDTWVRAAEFRIDQRQAIHHLNAFVRAPSSSFLQGFPRNEIFTPSVAERGKRKPDEPVFARREMLLGYEPGYQPMPWLDDGAKLIPAGSDIIFEMHYNPNGTEAVDHSQLGLYFAPAPPRYRILAIDTLRDLDLAIPPGSSEYHSEATMTLAQPARLLSLQPHMHVRGSSMKVQAIYPEGRTEILINVPRYDFNWQTTYVLLHPVELPTGTRLVSIAGYDNSANNRFNPDPSKTVHWGDQTTDEMHIAFLELVIDRAADPNSLFYTAPKMIGSKPGE